MRDIVKEIDTNNMWIDVLELDARKKDKYFDFSCIIIELFHRKIKPIYPKKDELSDNDYKGICKYITWQTATKDIANQRILNIKGPKYLIKCTLINRNKGKVIVEDAVWNNTFQRWVPKEWIMTPSCVIKKRNRYVPPKEDDFYYQIDEVKLL